VKTSAILLCCFFATVALAACDPPPAEPPRLQDQQIVCTLKGEAYIFIDNPGTVDRSRRSVEADSLCKALKPVEPAPIIVG
jgi:hypothetical protein